jgi:hypothetical protein
MPILDLITVLCLGLMIGNELCLSLFVNPALWKLDSSPQAKAVSLLARSLGKVMPFWYALCLLLLIAEAYIVAVELRYAERLHELPETPYESVPFDSAEAIFATHDRARELLQPLMDRDESFWETVLEFQTRSAGTLRATRRTVLVHLLTHSIRHYAQLATLSRKQGVAPDWGMDYILMQKNG